MAELGQYRMTSAGERILFSDGRFGIHGDCCCDPCVDCAADAPNAVVTITGACGGNPPCSDADSSVAAYSFDVFIDLATCCHWTWIGKRYQPAPSGQRWTLWLSWNKASKIFYGRLIGSRTIFTEKYGGIVNACNDITAAFLDISASNVACAGGKITGTFTLPGLGNCVGCTATVTLT